MSANSDVSSSFELPRPATVRPGTFRGSLAPLPRPDRAAGFLLHATPLAGILLPVIGHIGAPALVHALLRAKHPSISRHWPAVRLDQLRWGILCALSYLSVGFLGLAGVFLALAVTVPWAILVVVSASQAEGGHPVRRWWPGA